MREHGWTVAAIARIFWVAPDTIVRCTRPRRIKEAYPDEVIEHDDYYAGLEFRRHFPAVVCASGGEDGENGSQERSSSRGRAHWKAARTAGRRTVRIPSPRRLANRQEPQLNITPTASRFQSRAELRSRQTSLVARPFPLLPSPALPMAQNPAHTGCDSDNDSEASVARVLLQGQRQSHRRIKNSGTPQVSRPMMAAPDTTLVSYLENILKESDDLEITTERHFALFESKGMSLETLQTMSSWSEAEITETLTRLFLRGNLKGQDFGLDVFEVVSLAMALKQRSSDRGVLRRGSRDSGLGEFLRNVHGLDLSRHTAMFTSRGFSFERLRGLGNSTSNVGALLHAGLVRGSAVTRTRTRGLEDDGLSELEVIALELELR
uniref:Uncharacterized protein n=1 Tax=Mycena chlorophos TaxID=658473 RepID=A0ABQ0LKI5_MYCCL|nr:predicted protein [Mycena chlorophos]